MDEVRIDKWLWAVRFFKTRSAASTACQAGKVKLSGRSVKPSRTVKVGDSIQVTHADYKQQVEVTGLLEKRVGAKIATANYLDITPKDEIVRKELQGNLESAFYKRHRDSGRPTKRQRRDLNKMKEKF